MRRLKKANIKFISLVPAGANKIEPVYKDDGSFTISCLSKAAADFDEKGELLNIVYAPNHRDSQGDIADSEVIKQAAYDFVANVAEGGGVDVKHNNKPLPREKARVAETFLVQKTDTRFHGWKDRDDKDVDLTGAWATVIKIDDPELRKKYRSGEWAGVSMGGTAVVEQEKASLEEFFERLTKAVRPPNHKEEEPMDETKIMKAISDGFAELAKTLKPAAPDTPPKPETPPEEKPPAFTGNYENPRDVTKHARKIQLFKLRKGTNFNDPESMLAYNEAIALLKAEWEQSDVEAGIDVEAERKPVRKAGPLGGGNEQPTHSGVGISKVEQDLIKAGQLIAEEQNRKNGLVGAK